MKRVSVENINSSRDVTLLGGRLQLREGLLSLTDTDLLHQHTQYYYLLPNETSRSEFIKGLRSHYVRHGAVKVFNGSEVSYSLKYVPTVRFCNRLLSLNNEDDYFVTDRFFCPPLSWNDSWEMAVRPVMEGCLRSSDAHFMPINLSYREISYLAQRLGMKFSEPFQIVLVPFHKMVIRNREHEYHIARPAVGNTSSAFDYPLFNDTTFSALVSLLLLLVFYGICIAYMVAHSDQFVPWLQSYTAWLKENVPFPSFREIFHDYVPILGWIVGMFVEIAYAIVGAVIVFGVIPAIALTVPAIMSVVLAKTLLWTRRICLVIRKVLLFRRAMAF